MTAPIGYPEQFGALLDRKPIEQKSGPNVTGTEQGVLKPNETRDTTGPSFADQVAEFISGVDSTQKTSRTQAEEFAVGHSNDIHGTMIAVEQADISLRLLANVRNRAVDLYREVMRMGS
ncbi:MAG TPA: flagellar hook-basal body complex protein FliE [Polyangiales bacterium]|jgi:flagellar hook-basal body complex protein FliE|nr:flagellar hook-basal body complex protein FliE [Polyangiales bacterium]